jgi:streptogramin lyase
MKTHSRTGGHGRLVMIGVLLAASLSLHADARPAKGRGARLRAVVAGQAVAGVGSGPQFANPVGIAVEPAGSLAVVDAQWRAVLRVDAATGDRTLLSGEAESTTAFPESVLGEAAGTLLIGQDGPIGSEAGLIRLDPQTGQLTVISGPTGGGEPSRGSGPALGSAVALARENSGTLLVADREERAIFRVDPVTGNRAIVSGCTNFGLQCNGPVIGSGPEVTFPDGIAVETAGTILMAQPGQLLRVDALSGDRTAVSSATTGTGPALGTPGGIRVEASGTVLWADEEAVALFRIDPLTGDRATLSNASTGSGPAFRSVSDLAVEMSGAVVVLDAAQGLAQRVDPVTGDRTILSGGPIHTGPIIRCPSALVVEASGHIVVSDRCAAALIRVDAVTGDRTVVSDASRGSGALLEGPLDLALEASGDFLVVDHGELMRVEGARGARSTVSSETRGGGRPFRSPTAVAVEANGSAVVGDDGRTVCLGFPPFGICLDLGVSVIRVDPSTGDRTLLSGGGLGGNVGRGRKLWPFLELAVEPSGSIVAGVQTQRLVPLRRIDPVTGDRTRVTREGCCEFEVRYPNGITADPSGSLFIADDDLVLQVEPVRERVTLLSGLPTGPRSRRGSGPLFVGLWDIAQEEGGALIVADIHPVLPAGAILRVDPATGDRVYVSR